MSALNCDFWSWKIVYPEYQSHPIRMFDLQKEGFVYQYTLYTWLTFLVIHNPKKSVENAPVFSNG